MPGTKTRELEHVKIVTRNAKEHDAKKASFTVRTEPNVGKGRKAGIAGSFFVQCQGFPDFGKESLTVSGKDVKTGKPVTLRGVEPVGCYVTFVANQMHS